jgi:hypothetical protein
MLLLNRPRACAAPHSSKKSTAATLSSLERLDQAPNGCFTKSGRTKIGSPRQRCHFPWRKFSYRSALSGSSRGNTPILIMRDAGPLLCDQFKSGADPCNRIRRVLAHGARSDEQRYRDGGLCDLMVGSRHGPRPGCSRRIPDTLISWDESCRRGLLNGNIYLA